jgi:hypothetical protein
MRNTLFRTLVVLLVLGTYKKFDTEVMDDPCQDEE